MSNIARVIGQRLRYYRKALGYSQEKVAELAGCHPTYIGQIERGEKNATLESIEKITQAVNVPLSTLFENYTENDCNKDDIALKCYDFFLSKPIEDQQKLYDILIEIDEYKG